MASTICSTIFGDKPFRRLVEQHQRRIAHQRARDRQHLLLAAAHAPAGTVAHLAEIGKQREQLFARPVRRVRPLRLAADFEIFLDRQVGEDAPLLRHVAEPAAHDRMRRLARDVLAFEHDAARALLDQADDGAEGRRLAGAVAPEQRDHLALADLERDVEQDMRGAVIAVEILDLSFMRRAPSRWRAS